MECMAHAFPWFVTPCLAAFSFLESRFSFDAPIVEQLGRECFIRYRKHNRWVSIAYEPGSVPIVELFHPTDEIRNRRIPRLNTGLVGAGRFADNDENQQRRTLQSQAADLELAEKEFLTAA